MSTHDQRGPGDAIPASEQFSRDALIASRSLTRIPTVLMPAVLAIGLAGAALWFRQTGTGATPPPAFGAGRTGLGQLTDVFATLTDVFATFAVGLAAVVTLVAIVRCVRIRAALGEVSRWPLDRQVEAWAECGTMARTALSRLDEDAARRRGPGRRTREPQDER